MEKNINYNFREIQSLKHGENSFQEAGLYNFDSEIDWSLIQGIELNYDDILNSTVALEIISEFFDVSACAIVNHANPSAVALSSDVNSAWDKALDSDPISPFNSFVAFSQEVSAILAKKISEIPIKLILAPSFEARAIEILSKNPNLKLIQINTKLKDILNFTKEEIKITPFGALIQQKDKKDFDINSFKVVTIKKPQQSEAEDMIFAFKVAKHSKSNTVVIAKDLRTLSICSGQPNMTDCAEIALNKVCDSAKDAILATDGAVESINTLQAAIQNRIVGIIQPMGSIKDNEIIDYANKMNLTMISTDITHYRH